MSSLRKKNRNKKTTTTTTRKTANYTCTVNDSCDVWKCRELALASVEENQLMPGAVTPPLPQREKRNFCCVMYILFLYIHFTQSYGIGKNKDEGSIWHWYNLIKYSDQENIFHFTLSLFPFSFFVGLLLWSWLITITSLGNVRMMKCKRWAHELGVACLMKVVMPFIGLH